MKGVGIRTKADWIAFLEAVYEPAGNDATWARRLTARGASIFGDADFFGLTVLKHDAPCKSIEPLVVHDLPSALGDTVAAFDALGNRFVRTMFYPPSIVSTHLELSKRLPADAREYMAAFRRAWGCEDGLGLVVHPEPGMPLALYAGYARPVVLSRRERCLLTQIALHIETGYRLRCRPDSVKAIVSVDGRILHREQDAPPSQAVAAHVRRVERARTRKHRRTPEAMDLWTALVGGNASLVERTDGSRRQYVVIENAPSTQPIRALTSGEIDAVSQASRGLSGKLIAYALGISEATVSLRLASAASKIGLATRTDLVRIAAMLTRDPRARFEKEFALTTAERDVLDLLGSGLSNREIAAVRNRSVRTIANQVAVLLRKSGAPSRRALVARSS